MERDMNSQAASLCRGGCGFFGSTATDGLCSQCFKEALKRKQDTQRVSPTTSLTATGPSSSSMASSTSSCLSLDSSSSPASALSTQSSDSLLSSAVSFLSSSADDVSKSPVDACANVNKSAETEQVGAATTPTDQPQAAAASKKTNRCLVCKKRVGLTGFNCRCGGLYCGDHRYSDKHDCSFDYKSLAREELRKNNPVVVSEKIQRL